MVAKSIHQIDQQAAALLGPAPRYTPLYVRAAAVRAAIDRGDFKAANEAVRTVFTTSHISGWRFNPYVRFIRLLAHANDPRLSVQLDLWIKRDPRAEVPRLLRALREYDAGWAVRGNTFVSHISSSRLEGFSAHLQQAAQDAMAAVQRNPQDPYAAYVLLISLSGNGPTEAAEAAFQQGIATFPNYYPLYQARLVTLQPKWGGSIDALYAFVHDYAGRSSTYSPLRMLYLQLYADLVDTATVECIEGNTVSRHCVTETLGQIVTAGLYKRVYALLQGYPHVNQAQFSVKFGRILTPMVASIGTERPVGALLQIAAQSLHSDNALVANDTRGNNFMIDELTGLVWYQAGAMDNARKLFQRALTDLHNTTFASAEQRDAARTRIYHNLARAYDSEHRYRSAVIYQKVANTLGGPGKRDRECVDLYRLRLYASAIHTCGQQTQAIFDPRALFWRARSYEALGKLRLAIASYRQAADSYSAVRSYAAINMSVLYGRLNDMPGMLKVLNTYTYLYAPSPGSNENVALAYNNRCYAKMHLGDLRGALADCAASLRFGNLPDAYAKQQVLIKELRAQGKAPAAPPASRQPVGWHARTRTS